jgi:hypothetical protein
VTDGQAAAGDQKRRCWKCHVREAVAGAMLCTACITPAAMVKLLPPEPVSIATLYRPLSDLPPHIPEVPYTANVPIAEVLGSAPTRFADSGSAGLDLFGAQTPATHGYAWAITPNPAGSVNILPSRPGQVPAQQLERQPVDGTPQARPFRRSP